MANYRRIIERRNFELIADMLSITTLLLLLSLARAKPSASYNGLEFFLCFNMPCIFLCLTILRGMWRLSQQESESIDHTDINHLLHLADLLVQSSAQSSLTFECWLNTTVWPFTHPFSGKWGYRSQQCAYFGLASLIDLNCTTTTKASKWPWQTPEVLTTLSAKVRSICARRLLCQCRGCLSGNRKLL